MSQNYRNSERLFDLPLPLNNTRGQNGHQMGMSRDKRKRVLHNYALQVG